MANSNTTNETYKTTFNNYVAKINKTPKVWFREKIPGYVLLAIGVISAMYALYKGIGENPPLNVVISLIAGGVLLATLGTLFLFKIYKAERELNEQIQEVGMAMFRQFYRLPGRRLQETVEEPATTQKLAKIIAAVEEVIKAQADKSTKDHAADDATAAAKKAKDKARKAVTEAEKARKDADEAAKKPDKAVANKALMIAFAKMEAQGIAKALDDEAEKAKKTAEEAAKATNDKLAKAKQAVVEAAKELS